MKKIILLAVAVMTLSAASAQVTVKGSKIYDNISVTLKGGIVSPYQHYAFWKNARGVAGIELRKQVTPILGLGIEGEWSINRSLMVSILRFGVLTARTSLIISLLVVLEQ